MADPPAEPFKLKKDFIKTERLSLTSVQLADKITSELNAFLEEQPWSLYIKRNLSYAMPV